MSEEMFNPYKLELSRGEMLEQFYQAIMDIDVLGDIKDKLLADDEIEAWANLEVLQGGLRQPPAAETGARGDDSDDEAVEPLELSIQRLIPGLWRITHKDGVASMELVVEDATDPKVEIGKFISGGRVIDAIKLHRKLYGSELKEARDAVWAMRDNKPTYADLERKLAAAESTNERLANAIEPFAEAWLQVPYGLASTLRVWNGHYGDEAKYPILGISTDTLQDAHTAWAGLPDATGGEGSE